MKMARGQVIVVVVVVGREEGARAGDGALVGLLFVQHVSLDQPLRPFKWIRPTCQPGLPVRTLQVDSSNMSAWTTG